MVRAVWTTVLVLQCVQALSIPRPSLHKRQIKFRRHEGHVRSGKDQTIPYPYCKVEIDRDRRQTWPLMPTNFGECKFNIDNDREYLPDPKFYAALKDNVPQVLLDDAAAFQKEVDELQVRTRCNRSSEKLSYLLCTTAPRRLQAPQVRAQG
jgi:hypothetical protein